MKYRICPFGVSSWKVQYSWGPFWFDAASDYGEISFTKIFDTEKAAEEYIDKTSSSDLMFKDAKQLTKDRLKSIKPRIYP